jgi:predicted nucleic acid-binding protein
MIYLDTSALIKRFVAEAGSETVNDLVGKAPPIVTAKIAFAEVHAGLKRKHREGSLSGRDYALSVRQFEDDWESYIRVDLRDEILRLARDLIRQHPLRGFEAIHLSSALSEKTSRSAPPTRRASPQSTSRTLDIPDPVPFKSP